MAVLTLSAQPVRTSAMRTIVLALLAICCLTAYVVEGESGVAHEMGTGRWGYSLVVTSPPQQNGNDNFDSGTPCRFQRQNVVRIWAPAFHHWVIWGKSLYLSESTLPYV